MFKPRYRLTKYLVGCLERTALLTSALKNLSAKSPVRIKVTRDALGRDIHSSTWIEGNMLSLAQVAALVDGKKVDADARQKTEVKNCIQVLRWVMAHQTLSVTVRRILMLRAQMTKGILPSERCGHWEGDLLMGGRHASAIGTLVERTTRMTFLVKLENKYARNVRKAFADTFRDLPKGLKRTLTYDQGHEMAEHKLFTKETDIAVYFAHPSSPWERGTNENTNALLRQYFPKGTDLSKFTKAQLKEVQDEVNDRPRKTLGWHTPHEKFSELLH